MPKPSQSVWTHGSRLRRLARDDGGNVLAMGAAGLLVIAALVGGGVDMSRAYMVKNRLQSACDAGVLAGRKTVTTAGLDSASRTAAENYFNANFNRDQQDASESNFSVSTNDNGATVTGTATATVDTAVMQLFGKQEFDIEVECSAALGIGNSDVTMVLDTTGSMNSALAGTSQTRIQALRAAMKSFYDTVATATAGGNTRIRYAFVPYSSSVNVGRLIHDLDPDYLVDNYGVQSREPILRTINHSEFDHWGTAVVSAGTPDYSGVSNSDWSSYTSTQYSKQNACLDELPADTAYSNYGSPTTGSPSVTTNGSGQQVTTTTTTQEQRSTDYDCQKNGGKWYRYQRTASRNYFTYTVSTQNPVNRTWTTTEFDHWEYKRRTDFNYASYKDFTPTTVNIGSSGTDRTYTWAGCIEERDSESEPTFSFTSMLGITPNTEDLDIDGVPNTSVDETRWAPMWPEVAYYRTTSGGSLTNNDTSLYGNKAGSYCPARAKLFAEMTESTFDAYADSLVAEGSTYHDLGIIWGARISSPQGMWQGLVNEEPDNGGQVARHLIFMTDGAMEPSYSIQSTYGIEWHDRRVTDDGFSNDAARHASRFNAVCEAVKAKGIRIWVIAFSSALTTSLTSCASDDSSFLATNSTQLNSAFQTIATEVGELRITQ